MKKHNKTNKKSRSKSNRNLSTGFLLSSVCTIRCRGVPFTLVQASSGNGGISTASSGASLTAANSVPLDPFTLGGRAATLSADFMQYRILELKLSYQPYVSYSGMISTTIGATTTPSSAERGFAWGVLDDPGISGTLGFNSLIEYGAQVNRTCQRATISLRGGTLSDWRFISTTTSSPTAIDLRMVAPVKLWMAFVDTSSTSTSTYGAIIYDAIFQFRGPAQNLLPIGNPLPSISEKPESKQPEPNTKGWF